MRLFEAEYAGGTYQLVLQLAEIFRSGGGCALLVGGAVRDSLLGRKVKDFDVEVYGDGEGALVTPVGRWADVTHGQW